MYNTKIFKILEIIFIYILLPLFFLFKPFQAPLILMLIIVSVFLYLFLIKDKKYKKSNYNGKIVKKELINVFILFFILGSFLTIFAYHFYSDFFLYLPKNHPEIILLIIFGYSIFSVIPQGIIYRVYFTHRYSDLFKNKYLRIFIGASLFSFGHIIFQNLTAIIFTFFGGLIFLYRYERTKSMLLSNIEHAMYGCLIFFLGIGVDFFSRFAG